MTPPAEQYLILRIIISEIIGRHLNVQTSINITKIFVGQGRLVIFLMPQNEYLPAVIGGDYMSDPPPVNPPEFSILC